MSDAVPVPPLEPGVSDAVPVPPLEPGVSDAVPALPLEPVEDVERAASLAAGRSLAVEGIPMVLALEDVTCGAPGPAGPAGSMQDLGAGLADRLRTYHAVITPGADGDAYWPVHDALVVVSQAHGPAPA